MTDYVLRTVDDELDLLAGAAAIAIDGPKAVGKTSTARRRATTTFALEDPTELGLLRADPGRLEREDGVVLVDEWQRWPPVWDRIRRIVDENRRAKLLLTGSVPPIDATLHSGAGRILTLRMRPLSLAERQIETPTVRLRDLLDDGATDIDGDSRLELQDYVGEIVTSGFPGIRPLRGRLRRQQLDSYLERIVQRDMPEAGLRVRRPDALRQWMTAYAAATSTAASYEKILRATLGGLENPPTKVTALGYRDVLLSMWMLDPVPAWLPTRNRLGRLGQSPKHHLADPALAARLLGLTVDGLLRRSGPSTMHDGPLLGRLFESLVTISLKTYAQLAESRVFHTRSRNGDHEVDLIVERADGRVVAIEVKIGAEVDDNDVTHLHWLRKQIGDSLLDAIIVTTGRHAYRREDGIAVIPASLLGP